MAMKPVAPTVSIPIVTLNLKENASEGLKT